MTQSRKWYISCVGLGILSRSFLVLTSHFMWARNFGFMGKMQTKIVFHIDNNVVGPFAFGFEVS